MNQAKWMPIAAVFLGVNVLAVAGTSIRHFASAQTNAVVQSQSGESSPDSNPENVDQTQLSSDPNALQAKVATGSVGEISTEAAVDQQPQTSSPLNSLDPLNSPGPLDSLEIPPAGSTTDLENEPFFQEFMQYFSDRENQPEAAGQRDKTASQPSVSRLAIERSRSRASSAEHLAIAIQNLLAQAERDFEAGETAAAEELFATVQQLQKISGELISR
ncbi:MAG: hypothetical protein AAGG44_04940 [Planctomycetota bacterium]